MLHYVEEKLSVWIQIFHLFCISAENLCLDSQTKTWRLKLIDFGSSQTPDDTVTEGLTNEYLSPESCRKILQVQNSNDDK